MRISNVNLEELGCQLLRYRITPSQYSGRSFWNNGSVTPSIIPGQYMFSNLEVDIYIEGESAADVERRKSNLNAMMENPTIVLDEVDSGIYYDCAYENQVVVEKINEVVSILTYNFKTFKRGEQITISLTKLSNIVNVIGNVETDIIYEITPSSDIVDFSINNLLIKNLKANKTVIVDGRTKKVSVEGQNKFNDTDFWSFPKLKPGNNTLVLSKSNVAVKLIYYPRYV